MARALETQISSKASRVLRTGNITSAQAQTLKSKAAAIKFEKKAPTSPQGSTSKGMRLLDLFLDEKLKESGHDVDAERKARNESNSKKKKELLAKAAKAQEEAKRLTGQRSFKEVIEAVAREKMKGIYTAFTSENLSPEPNGKTQLCVLLKYSPRSEKLADMMAARDFSNAPQLNPDIPLLEQLPDPTTGQGVFQLVTMWGINVMVDEGGQVNLVAFGQAGYTNGDENQQQGAKEEAKLRAENLIRLFINQTVAVQQASKLSQDVKTYKDGVKKTKLNKSLRSKMEQSAGFRPVNGLKQILDWDGIHPVTNGGIAGAIVAWNANEAAGAVASKARQNRVVKDRGGVKARNAAPSMRRSAKPKSRRGGLRGSTRSADF
jgi:Skp family chaperone for outer membrane proteins